MKQSKQILKRIIDLAMIVLLPLLMAEILTGQEIHEWLGTGMLVLFLAHHFLNLGWWKSFLKGKYTPSRTFGTALDLLRMVADDNHIVYGSDFPHSPAKVIIAKKKHFESNEKYAGLVNQIYSANASGLL